MIEFLTTSLIDPAITTAWWDSYKPAILPSVIAGLWILCGIVRFYKQYVASGVWFVDPGSPLSLSSNLLATILQALVIWVMLGFLEGAAIVLLYPIVSVMILAITSLSALFYYTAIHARRREELVEALRGDE